ncbi:hypothetical protein [Haloarchaeobius salinus]|uniref:hypothetical protein n=1 Tax=Haloarchaeobius salinus TaxID=1198298 RepID=UPI00210B81E8|nr:hypothetical protein [Haloarchaeobius salinus]
MQRRDALKLLPTAALGGLLAGCTDSLSAEDPAGTDTPSTGDPTTTRATTDGGDGSPSVTDLAVESTNQGQYVLRLNDLGRGPAAEPAAVSELDDPERTVVEAALDGGYETDETPLWLQRLVARTRHVVDGEQYYRLEHTLPVSEITGERVDESEVDSVASQEAYREAVTHDGVVFSGLVRIALEDGFRTPYVWPSLDEFLTAYDAVEYRGEGVVRLTRSTEDAAPPFTVTATAVEPTDLVEEPVWDARDAPADVRSTLSEAATTSGTFALDDPPAGLLDGLDAHDYLYLDGRFYTTYVENREPLPVSVSATVVTDLDVPAFELRLRNDADGTVSVTSGAPAPFGVLSLRSEDDESFRSLLWRDAYEESSHVHTDGRTVTAVNDIGVGTEIPAGESMGATFELAPDVPAGEYVVDDGVGVRLPDGGGGTFSYLVRVTVS